MQSVVNDLNRDKINLSSEDTIILSFQDVYLSYKLLLPV